MIDTIITFFRDSFQSEILTIIFIAILPIIELRGALPVGFELELAWYEAYGYAFLGSMLVVPILLLLLKPILNWMKKIKIFNSLAVAVEDMFNSKAKKISQKAGKGDSEKKEIWIKCIGVCLFVALPLPLTGVWTGTAIAVFLGIKFWPALGAIFVGNLTAGAIVTLICVFFRDSLDTILNWFLIIVVVILALFILKLVLRMVKNKKAKKNILTDTTDNVEENRLEDSENNEDINENKLEDSKDIEDINEK